MLVILFTDELPGKAVVQVNSQDDSEYSHREAMEQAASLLSGIAEGKGRNWGIWTGTGLVEEDPERVWCKNCGPCLCEAEPELEVSHHLDLEPTKWTWWGRFKSKLGIGACYIPPYNWNKE